MNLFRHIRPFRRDQSGASSVEVAFAAMLFGTFAIGVVDMAVIGMGHLRLHQVAKAGVQYGSLDWIAAADHERIIQAARDEAGELADRMNIEVRDICSCGGDAIVNCEDTCVDGAFAPLYVEVTVSDRLQLPITFAGALPNLNIQTTARARIR